MNDLRVSLTTTLNDRLIGPLQRLVADAGKQLGGMERNLQGVGAASQQAGEKLGVLTGSAASLARVRGIEKVKGDLSSVASEAERATRSTNKLKDALTSVSGLARGAASVVAGISAARFVLAAPFQRTTDYQLELARLSNIAYSDRKSVAGRASGQHEMDTAIRAATLQGGTRGDALVGLKTLISAGMDRNTAMTVLPTMAKFSVAGDAQMGDVAKLAIASMRNFKIDPKNLPAALETALMSAKLGSFEFKDMAQWLPSQMANASQMVGMRGAQDLATLLTVNQFASSAAGGNAEAGNNVVNFLSKLNSDDTRKDFDKLGIDLTGSLAAARGKGMGQVDAFIALLREVAQKDPAFRKAEGDLLAARKRGAGPDEIATKESVFSLMQGKALSKVVQDRQALSGLLPIVADPQGFAEMRKQVATAMGDSNIDQATVMATAAMKYQQGENAERNREFDALRGMNDALADSQAKLAALSGEYPEAAKALETLKLAAYAAAAATGAAGAMNLVTGGGLAKLLGLVGGGGALAAAGSLAVPALAVGAAGVAGAGAGTLVYKGALEDNKAGDAVGATVAQILAFFGNKEAQQSVGARDSLDNYEEQQRGAAEARKKAVIDANTDAMMRAMSPLLSRMDQIVQRPIVLKVDGRELFTTVETHAGHQARRN